MDTLAAVLTGKGSGAISSIQLAGTHAKEIIKKIFKPAAAKTPQFATGQIILGNIVDKTRIIDQVIIGCEAPDEFAINCHGNPLIVEMIMDLLQQMGAKLVTPEKLLTHTLSKNSDLSHIQIEAKITQPNTSTFEGAKIIANQSENGLALQITSWLRSLDSISLEAIKTQTKTILANSQIANFIINRCNVVIAGPANSGKSTLLNYLAGRQKSIVSDIKGTTRDWTSARCEIKSLAIELFDTAGLDFKLTSSDPIDIASQKKALEILDKSDLVLLVLDSAKGSEQIKDELIEKLAGKKVITILNKSDLPAKLAPNQLSPTLAEAVKISALSGEGTDKLIEKMRQALGVADFDTSSTVCFTDRQRKLLTKLANTEKKSHACLVLTELLNGKIRV